VSPTALSRLIRGGVWFGTAGACRSAARFDITPTLRNAYFGFRLAAVQ